MTPLAHRIVKDLTLPIKKRCGDDEIGIREKMSDIHCFELSEVLDLLIDIAHKFTDDDSQIGTLGFLPAPKTWIEFCHKSGGPRQGFLLIENKERSMAKCFFASETMVIDDRRLPFVECPHGHDPDDPPGNRVTYQDYWTEGAADLLLVGDGSNQCHITDVCKLRARDGVYQEQALLYAALATINTPRIIGRKQHMPHRGLESKLVRARGIIGKFPLHAWTEIKLHVIGPHDLADKTSVEAHYTGQRALHFCRAHLRIRLGRLEIVRSHWRGDASIGIKQSRYKLVS